jgi:biopolymer transport protein ExbD
MRNWDDGHRKQARIEIIPMIDVMMFLLVFFVLISINVIPALGIKTNLPQSSQALEIKAVKNVVITLAKTGETQLDGALVELDELTARLRAIHEAPNQTVNVMINGDEAVSMQRLVDVMDAVKASGIDSLAMATKKRN